MECRNPAYPHRMQWLFRSNNQREKYMTTVIREEAELLSTYSHVPADDCAGVGKLHCMPGYPSGLHIMHFYMHNVLLYCY